MESEKKIAHLTERLTYIHDIFGGEFHEYEQTETQKKTQKWIFKGIDFGEQVEDKTASFLNIIGDRLSITDDRAGVTRDRIYSTGEWLGHKFNLIDTGGIDIVDAPFLEEIRAQAEIAIEEAEVIIFVVDPLPLLPVTIIVIFGYFIFFSIFLSILLAIYPGYTLELYFSNFIIL